MRIDALMAALDTQMLTDAAAQTGSGAGGESPFSQLLASLQGQGMVQSDPTATWAAAATGGLLPLTDLLMMMGQYTAETEATPAQMGDLLLSSTTERAIPLTEALAALQMLINQGTGAGADASPLGDTSGDQAASRNPKEGDVDREAVLDLVVPMLNALNPTVNPAAAETDSSETAGPSVDVTALSGVIAGRLPSATAGESKGPEFGQTLAQTLGSGDADPAPTGILPETTVPITPPGEEAPSFQQTQASVVERESVEPLPAAGRGETAGKTVEPVSDQTPVFYARAMAADTSNAVTTTMEVDAPVAVEDAPVVEQIVSAVDLIGRDGDSEVRLRLHPKELGQLLVQVHMTRGDVSIHMVAETTMGQAVIEEHLAQLRDAFRNQGITVDGLTVTVGSDSSAFNAPTQQQTRQSQDLPFLVATESLHEKPNVAESQTSSSWLHGRTHTVDYHV